MSAEHHIQEIPVFQTAEQLVGFLLDEFMFVYAMNGMVILTNDDLRILADSLQGFMNSSARSEGQDMTDNRGADS